MPKSARRRKAFPSESESRSGSGSENEEASDTPAPPRRRKTVPQRGNGRPYRGGGPPRRHSMPGEYPQDSDDEPPQAAGAGRDGHPKRASRQAGPGGRGPVPSRQRSKKVTGPISDDEDGPGPTRPAGRRRHHPPEFGPIEPDDTLGDGDDEALPPRSRPADGWNAEPGNQDELVFSGRSAGHPTAMARHGGGAPVDFDPIEPDLYIGDIDDQIRQALAASLQEARGAVSHEGGFDEEELRKVLEASMLDASTQEGSSGAPDEEEQIWRIIEASQREHEILERRRARREVEVARREEESLQKSINASARAARESGHQEAEEELARALSLSEAAHAEDVRRRAQRMALGRATSTSSASYTETLAGRQSASSNTSAPSSTHTTPAEIPKPATTTTKSKQGILQSMTGSLSSTSPKPSTRSKTKPKPSPLAPIPGNAVASSSTAAKPSPAKAQIIKSPEPPVSQALIPFSPPRPPPIEYSALIALCEKTFPQDPGITAAFVASKQSAAIYNVQHDSVFDAQMAATIAESAAEHERTGEKPADMTEVGLDDPPPEYFACAKDRDITPQQLQYTTTDYRREQWGYRKRISKGILEIMRLWREFLAWEAECGPPDAKGRRKASPFGPLALPAPPNDHQGKGKASSLLALPAQLPTAAAVAAAPPEVAESLSEISRPALRAQETIAAPSAAAARYMATDLPPQAQDRVRRMQMQSQLISQSKLPGTRPRKPVEP